MTATKNYQYKYPNESFSGCDMTATIVYPWLTDEQNYSIMGRSDPGMEPDEMPTIPSSPGLGQKRTWNSNVLGEIQTMSYSIHMEKRPVRSIGNVNAKDYVMGPRTIAGSLVFAVFNKHFATDIIAAHNSYFKTGTAFIVDELPPFNIVISMANEYGLRSKLVVYGVRLVNEGQVMSVNDVFTENTYQFVATDIEYLNAEMKYASRKNNDYWINIKDTVPTTNFTLNKNIENEELIQYHDPDRSDIEKIIMMVSKKDAIKDKNGKASISLLPTQKEGTVTITPATGDSDKSYIIHMNGKSSYTIDLPPDLYVANFTKPNPQNWVCLPKNFLIDTIKEDNNVYKYSPVIDCITDTSLKVYSNEHEHTSISIRDDNDQNETIYSLKNRKFEINDLNPSTTYHLYTFKNDDKSPTIKVETHNNFKKIFNEFKTMSITNSNLLLYGGYDKYLSLIDEAYDLAVKDKKYDSPINYIILIKQEYEKELKSLSDTDENYYNEYKELKTKIDICSELILLSIKVHNNRMLLTNKQLEIDSPTVSYDESYNSVFKFNNNIEKGEFFRIVNGKPQTSDIVNSKNLKDKKTYTYKGRSGYNHYVQSVIEKSRSCKLEFYEMSLKEKEERFKYSDRIMTSSDIIKIQHLVNEDLKPDADINTKERAFMVKAKNIYNPILLPPHVKNIKDDSIDIETLVSDFVLDEDQEFYLCVANIKDIINNDYIYKKKITSIDNSVRLQDIDCALFNGVNYSVWIEDSCLNQISNATTFRMNDIYSNEDEECIAYELKSVFDFILNTLKDKLPSSIFATLSSELKFNSEINSSNIINRALEVLFSSSLNESVLIDSLKSISSIIGPMINSNSSVMNIEYNNHILSYESDNTINSLVVSMKNGYLEYNISKSKIIDIKNINSDYVLVIGLDNKMKYKTDIIFINKNNNKMEVL